MGKGNWFSSVKKAISPDSKEKKEQKSKNKWIGKQKYEAASYASPEAYTTQPLSPPVPPPEEELRYVENDHSHSVAAASPSVFEAEVPTPPVVDQVIQHSSIARFAGKSKEEIAAIKIQTAFRGYMSRRALRALKGLVRLKALMEGAVVKRQAANTLRSMQTLSRVQSQIRYRRVKMSEDNQALQKQLLQNHAVEFEKLRIGEEWDDSIQSKEQVEASLLSKHEATMRRERALAYAFSHQQTVKNSSKPVNPMFVDPSNPSWGWSWLERWMAARSWEIIEKDLNDSSSMKSASQSIPGGEISKAYARYQLDPDKQSPTASQKPSCPKKPASPRVARKLKPTTPKITDDDSKSMQSVRFRRHSIAGSTIRDEESMATSPALPSYMVPTESARAKSRLARLAGEEKDKGTPEMGAAGVAKKRLAFPQSPARPPRRHSGPPKVDISIAVANGVSNGGST